MPIVLLSLGSNLHPQRHLQAAVRALRGRFGRIVVSPAYRTPAVGFDGPDFLNNAVMLDTDEPLPSLDRWLHDVEDANGRDRSGPRWGDRTLDIDVVYYGNLVAQGPGHLRIPRPELKHAFVLKPLADIAPDFIDPVRGQTLRQMWREHPQREDVFEVVELADDGAP